MAESVDGAWYRDAVGGLHEVVVAFSVVPLECKLPFTVPFATPLVLEW